MRRSLKEELIIETTRSKYANYNIEDLEMLNEYQLQSLLQNIILEGVKHENRDLSNLKHIRNK
jgi:hypothetical protein